MFIITWLDEKAVHVIVVNLSILLWIRLASFHKIYFNISCKSKAACSSSSSRNLKVSIVLNYLSHYIPHIPHTIDLQRVWLGHTLRHCDLVPLVIEGRIIGRRPPGRPRAGMLDRVKDGSPYVALKRLALNREL